jgi:hypothetical protein
MAISSHILSSFLSSFLKSMSYRRKLSKKLDSIENEEEKFQKWKNTEKTKNLLKFLGL